MAMMKMKKGQSYTTSGSFVGVKNKGAMISDDWDR
jgi:hypothetical protein